MATNKPYKSPFGSPGTSWDLASWVRSKPFRTGGLSGPKLFYSPKLVRYFEHPAVAELPPAAKNRLLAHHLIRWLHFTEQVEDRIVIPAAVGIAAGGTGFDLPAQARRDAHVLKVDEAAHTLFSHDLGAQVGGLVGLAPSVIEHLLIRRIDERLAAAAPADHDRIRFARSIATETLITGELGASAREPDVHPVVAAVIDDHAEDEARHTAYFLQMFGYAWEQLGPDERVAFATEIAHGVADYIALDAAWLQVALDEVGVRDPAGVAATIAASPGRVADLRAAAAPTVGMLRAKGALRDARIVEALQRLGLV
jgi:hypothetical protein